MMDLDQNCHHCGALAGQLCYKTCPINGDLLTKVDVDLRQVGLSLEWLVRLMYKARRRKEVEWVPPEIL